MSGFDDIINNLDGWLERPAPALPLITAVRPPAPTFRVGDIIIIRETKWPPENGRINKTTGLYREPGYPQLPKDLPVAMDKDDLFCNDLEIRHALQVKLAGSVQIGDRCHIMAVWCHEDGKTYYFLDNCKPNGKGWTRCSFRFRHATEDEKRQY